MAALTCHSLQTDFEEQAEETSGSWYQADTRYADLSLEPLKKSSRAELTLMNDQNIHIPPKSMPTPIHQNPS